MDKLQLPEGLCVRRYNTKLQASMGGQVYLHKPSNSDFSLDQLVRVKYVYTNKTVKVVSLENGGTMTVPLRTLREIDDEKSFSGGFKQIPQTVDQRRTVKRRHE